jgi:peroxiredoxin (alkyl hydroperoxide reductase subunit C)
MAELKLGDPAPDFELPALFDGARKKFKLSDYQGAKNVVIVFHPLNWTPICEQQLPAFNAALHSFTDLDAEVVGISVDSIYSTAAWEKEIGPLHFSLASDYYPHGEVAQRYGVFRYREPFAGVSERAIFIVNKHGKLVFSKVYEMDKLPNTEEVLAVVRGLNS